MDIDVHSYQEELDTIVNEAKAVIARMDEMKHRFDAVAAAVDTVEHSVQKLKTDVDAHVAATAQREEAFYAHAGERIHQWDAQVAGAYQKAVADLGEKIKAAHELFLQKAGTAYEAVDKSHGIVQQLGELVKSTDHDVMDGVRNSIHAVQDDHAQFKQQFDGTTQPSLHVLDDLLNHTLQQGESFTNETHDHIEQIKQQTDEHMQQDLFQPLQMHLGETAQKVGQIASADVDAKLHDVLAQSRDQLEQHAKQVIANLVDKVASELDQVSDHIHQAGQSSAIPREAMKPIIDGIEQLIKPVEETIGNVKSVAAAVGFDV